MKRWLARWLWLPAFACYLVAVWIGAIELNGVDLHPWGGYIAWGGTAILIAWEHCHSREMRRLRAELAAVRSENDRRRQAELKRRWAE